MMLPTPMALDNSVTMPTVHTATLMADITEEIIEYWLAALKLPSARLSSGAMSWRRLRSAFAASSTSTADAPGAAVMASQLISRRGSNVRSNAVKGMNAVDAT